MNPQNNSRTFTLTKEDAQECLHKIGVLADTPDLQEDYHLTQDQADELQRGIPHNGGEWAVPGWAVLAVVGEMGDHAVVLRRQADESHSEGRVGEALRTHKQATKFERIFT